MRAICSIVNCGRLVIGQGFCASHYRRLKRHGDPLGGQRTFHNDPISFLKKIIAAPHEDCCIEWPFSQKNGYGELRFGGMKQTSHRVSLLLAKGEPPVSGMVAAHAPSGCHNPLCVNPLHLRWATYSENARDMLIDGTSRRGSDGPRW